MKTMKCLGLVVLLGVSVSGRAWSATVEKPVVMKDALMTVVASDIHGLVDGAASISSSVSPSMNASMLKVMLGTALGDPGLEGIAPGKGLAVVALDPTNIFAVVEIGEAKASAYQETLEIQGMASEYAGGMLVIAPDESLVAKGQAVAADVKAQLLSKRSPTLRIAMQPAALLSTYKEDVDGFMELLPTLMGMSLEQEPPAEGIDPLGALKILEAEMRVIVSMASQCDAMEIVIAPKNGGLQISKTLSATPGSKLAKVLQAPSTRANPKVQAGLLGDSAIAVDGTMDNVDAIADFVESEILALSKDMEIDAAAIKTISDTMKKWIDVYGGGFSEAIDFGGESFMNIGYVMEVKDAAKAMQLFGSMEKDMAPLLDLYKSMGVPMNFEFKSNVREYKGVMISQMKVGVEMPEMAEADAQMLEMMNLNLGNMAYDVAIVDGLMVYSMGGTGVETMIDRIKDAGFRPAPLKARSVFPANAVFYCDIDVAKYIEGIASIMPLPDDSSNPLPGIIAMMQGAEPITAAGFLENGMAMGSVNIPGSLISKICAVEIMAQMEPEATASAATMQIQ